MLDDELALSAWDNLESHQAFMNDKIEYPKLHAALAKSVDKLVALYHAKFPTDIIPALDAPCTEIVSWTLLESADRDEFHAGVKGLILRINTDLKDELLGGDVGEVLEDQKKFSVILGWYSLEVRCQTSCPPRMG